MPRVTMDDIAEVAGVSKSTVSRALNYDPRVNEDTREKILAIAREMNYKPHRVAQALAKKTTNVLGVMLPSFPRSVADPFFLEFLQGIGEIAVPRGYSLTLINLTREKKYNVKKVLSEHRVDGFVLTEPMLEDPRVDILKEQEIPFVFLGNPMQDDVYWLEVDNTTGAYQAVKYLIDNGHKKIATIAGSQELVAGKYRLEGYKKALKEASIEINPSFIRPGDFTRETAYQATKKLIAEEKGNFTAIFAANDLMALAVIKALKEEGLSVPEDVAVIGYDGIQMGEYIDPPLSTIKLPIKRMGRRAIRILLDLIDGKYIVREGVLFDPEVLIRGSV